MPQRLDYIDIARALGMAMVIVGHVLIVFVTIPLAFNPTAFAVTKVIYAFHMPLFFFLSGLTYRKRAIRAVAISTVALLLLAQLTHLVGVVLDYLANGKEFDPLAALQTLVLLRDFSIGVTWFLVSIAFVRLMFALLCESGRLGQVFVMILVAISLVATIATDITVLQVQTLWAGLLFYALGRASLGMRRPVDDARKILPIKAVTVVVAGMAVSLTAVLNMGCTANPFAICSTSTLHGNFIVRMISGQYGFLPLFVLTALCGTVTVISLAKLLENLPLVLRARLIWIGRNTLALLLLNGCFLVIGNPMIRAAASGGYAAWVPWGIAFTVLLMHLAALPLVSPVVRGVEIAIQRVAETLITIVLQQCRRQ